MLFCRGLCQLQAVKLIFKNVNLDQFVASEVNLWSTLPVSFISIDSFAVIAR